jgi:hypothetical protein
MVNFVCDGCHYELQIGDEWAGKFGHCPHCGTNSRVPGSPKRTSRLTIIVRWFLGPTVVLLFWAGILNTVTSHGAAAFLFGGLAATAGSLIFLWAFTNIFTFIMCPSGYKVWKKNGGDPFFDTVPEPFNNDPPATRYQELFREQAKQDCEEVDRMFGVRPPTPPAAPDVSRGINDPKVI